MSRGSELAWLKVDGCQPYRAKGGVRGEVVVRVEVAGVYVWSDDAQAANGDAQQHGTGWREVAHAP